MNETLHRKNIPGIHDYNLRILRDSQRLGIAIVATVLLIATVITNVSSFIANFKRSVFFTNSFARFSETEFWFFYISEVFVRYFVPVYFRWAAATW